MWGGRKIGAVVDGLVELQKWVQVATPLVPIGNVVAHRSGEWAISSQATSIRRYDELFQEQNGIFATDP